jgi:hypothetical protein
MPGWATDGGGGFQQLPKRAKSSLMVLTWAGSAGASVGPINNSAAANQIRTVRARTNLAEPRTGVT